MHNESFFAEATLIEIGVYKHKVELKSLYFSLVYVFLFSSKTRIYQQNIHKGELKTLYFKFVWLLKNRFLPSISRKIKSQGFTRR